MYTLSIYTLSTYYLLTALSTHYLQLSTQEEEWLEAELETVTSLISSEYLRVDSEYQVFTATMAWIHHDIANRYNNIFIRASNEGSRRFYNNHG